MKNSLFTLPVILVTLIFSSYSLALDEQDKKLISETVFQDMDGNNRVLNDYIGKEKWTIVMLWISDCHVCNQEASEYDDFHDKHKDTDARILGISMDGIEGKRDALAFIKRNEVGFPNLIGDPQTVASLYIRLTGGDWVGTPTFLIFSPAGELKAAQPGAVPVSLIEEYIIKNSKPADSKM
ncbi:MAG TPA: TlpA family protein disulfide reductase [Gammaproteobacteria bacterium]|nr:TlpA family protein disulfide reductase [Gammaproteobacteria bacterium]